MKELTEADRKAIEDEIKKHNWQSILYVNTFRRGAEWGIKHARAEKLDAFEQTSWLMNHKNERIKELEAEGRDAFATTLTQEARIMELEAEVAMYKEDARILKAQRIHDMKVIAALQSPAKDTPDHVALPEGKYHYGEADEDGVKPVFGAFDQLLWYSVPGLSTRFTDYHEAGRIAVKLKPSPVPVDINRELVEALEAMLQVSAKWSPDLYPDERIAIQKGEAALSKAQTDIPSEIGKVIKDRFMDMVDDETPSSAKDTPDSMNAYWKGYRDGVKDQTLIGNPKAMSKHTPEITPDLNDEAILMHQTSELWNTFVKLPSLHSMEHVEFCDAIHRIQDLIGTRIAMKTAPEIYGTRK